MDNLKTIESRVKDILEKSRAARNDDMLLYFFVCDDYLTARGIPIFCMTFETVMKQYKPLGLPSFESISRIRRKLQAEFPGLMGNDRVRRFRATGEKVYRKYAKT